MLQSYGTLLVTPSQSPGKWWLHCQCCDELGRYYRSWITKRYGEFYNIMRPRWGVHITIIRREGILLRDIQLFHGQTIYFDYDNERISTNLKHFWLPVRCDKMKNIREQLGLPRKPQVNLHLTFGVLPGEGG